MNTKKVQFKNKMTLLLKDDIQNFSQPLKIVVLCSTIFFSYMYIMALWSEETEILQHLLAWFTLYFCGILLVTTTFKEIFSTPKNYTYLTIPASNAEKILSKIILSTAFCILFSIVFNVVFTLIAASICEPILKLSFGVFTPFTQNYFLSIGIYLTLIPLILLVSSYYKKYTRGKILFYLGVAVILLLVIWHFNETFNMPFGLSYPISPYVTNFRSITMPYSGFTNVVKYYQWIVFAPLFWLLFYREFKKMEA